MFRLRFERDAGNIKYFSIKTAALTIASIGVLALFFASGLYVLAVVVLAISVAILPNLYAFLYWPVPITSEYIVDIDRSGKKILSRKMENGRPISTVTIEFENIARIERLGDDFNRSVSRLM